eukprot:jgi/Tetstr1/420514/TSEL_001058.t1
MDAAPEVKPQPVAKGAAPGPEPDESVEETSAPAPVPGEVLHCPWDDIPEDVWANIQEKAANSCPVVFGALKEWLLRGADAPRPGQRGADAPQPGQRGGRGNGAAGAAGRRRAAAEAAGRRRAAAGAAGRQRTAGGVAFHNPRDNAFGVAIGVEKLA